MTAILRYMGSKRELAPQIAALISKMHPDAIIADAFAGTCAIGCAVAPRHTVFANDLHQFAEIVAKSLLVSPGKIPNADDARKDLLALIEGNYNALLPLIEDRVQEERIALQTLENRGDWHKLVDFTEKELQVELPNLSLISEGISTYRNHPTHFPYVLFSAYFASAYFGVKQAAMIDSIRYAIDQADVSRKEFYLLALMHAVSYCGAAPGHFAQYLIPRDSANTRVVAGYRRRNVLSKFMTFLNGLKLPNCKDRYSNRTYCGEAVDFVVELANVGKPLVIYADPPYSRAQYSRYYHVLETLVRYDYPGVEHKGRYRNDRVTTGFSQVSQVSATMSKFIETAANAAAPLYISYPAQGLLDQAGGDMLSLLQEHYNNVRELAAVPLSHSTMGGAPGTGTLEVVEKVYYAK